MKILFLDTSSSVLYCGLYDNENAIFEITKLLERDMSKEALFLIQKKFNENNISPSFVEKIILVNGPGSFTGIRIGATIAKVFAWTLNIPITTITSLEAITASYNGTSKYIIPLIDARRGFVYGQIFDGLNNPITEPEYILLDKLVEKVQKLSDECRYISNDNLPIVKEEYKLNIKKIVEIYKDKECINPHSIDALYLKLTEAEENAKNSSC